jgi:ankyrin repeat protein
MKRTRRRTALLAFVLLVGLAAIPIGLTWREMRQERLNHALIAAIDQGNTGLVRHLLRQGADPNTATIWSDDKRPAWQRFLDMGQRSPTSTVAPQETALSKAIEWEPTAVESSSGDKEALIQALVEAGADVNGRCRDYDFYYHFFRIPRPFGTVPLVAAAERGQWAAVQFLLEHHANINATDEDGNSVLMYASTTLDSNRVESLIERGANVNTKDNHGATAPFWACHAYEPRRHDQLRTGSFVSLELRPDDESEAIRATIACLLRHGASVNGRDSEGKTVLQRAQGQRNDPQLIQMLKQAGAKE